MNGLELSAWTATQRPGIGWILALPGLVLLLAGCATTAQKTAAPLEPPKPYLRVERAPDSTLSLQVAVRQLQGPGRRSPEILLVGVAHIGESNYYASLQQQLDAASLVLFEGVGGRPEKPSPEEASAAGDGQLGSLQSRLARALGLVFQLDAIDYDRPHFKNSDVKLERLFELMQGEGKAKESPKSETRTPKEYRIPKSENSSGLVGDFHPSESDSLALISSPEMIMLSDDAVVDLQMKVACRREFPLPEGEGQGEGGFVSLATIKPQFMESSRVRGAVPSSFNPTAVHGDGGFGVPHDASLRYFQHAMVIQALLNVSVPEEAGTKASASRGLDDLVGIMDGTSLLGALAHTLVEMIGASPRLQATVKVVLIETMGALEGDLAQAKGLPPDLSALMDVLIRERNQVVLADVRAALSEKKPPRRIAVFYGAGHMHDLEQRLCADLGYRPVADQWLTAFSLNPRAAGLSEMELNMVRSLVKWQMEQLQQGGK